MSDAAVTERVLTFLKSISIQFLVRSTSSLKSRTSSLEVLNQTFNLEIKILWPYKYTLVFQFSNKYFLPEKEILPKTPNTGWKATYFIMM